MRGGRRIRASLYLLAGLLAFGCEGDGSDGASPLIRIQSTPDCVRFSGGFPSGLTPLPGAGNQAAAVQFIPTAILGLNLNTQPPSLLATSSVPNFPIGAQCGACPFPALDSDGDGISDACNASSNGDRCSLPVPGNLQAVDAQTVALATSNYEQLVFFDPRSGATRSVELDTPPMSATFEPADWPLWPVPGLRATRTALSTRACAYTNQLDSVGLTVGSDSRCAPGRNSFLTGFTGGSATADGKIFVAMPSLLDSSFGATREPRYAPGSVLVFDYDSTVSPPRVRPNPTQAILFTSGFNPTSVKAYTTPSGRSLILVAISGAIKLGSPAEVRTASAIDVIDATTLEVIATVPLGLAGLGDSGISIDATGRIALVGSFTSRALFGIDLAPLDAPTLGRGPESLPVVLDGTTPGFGDARLYHATRPFVLPKRADGPASAQCSPITSVGLSPTRPYAAATEFCDGTVTAIDLSLPANRNTTLDPAAIMTVDRQLNVVAPILPSSTGQVRAIDRVFIRDGEPVVDYSGPDVYFTAGLPQGGVCGVRVRSF